MPLTNIFLGLVLIIFINLAPGDGFVQNLLRLPSQFLANSLLTNRESASSLHGGSPIIESKFQNFSLEFSRTFNVATPSYVQILNEGMLSITSFSLLRKGSILEYDMDHLESSPELLSPRELKGEYLWPNELSSFTDSEEQKVLLVPDGFLLPGQNDGGLYAITNPHLPSSKPVRLTSKKPGWFFHKAVHVTLPGGRQGILTARAQKPFLGKGQGELVWIDNEGGTKAWTETVLAQGPDVMFEVLDMDPSDDSIEVVAAHFFGRKLSIHSLHVCAQTGAVEISHTTDLKTQGQPYGLCLANLEDAVNTGEKSLAVTSVANPTHLLVSTHECSYDILSAVKMAASALAGRYPFVRAGPPDMAQVLARARNSLLTNEGSAVDIDSGMQEREDVGSGGTLFAYSLPSFPSLSPSREHVEGSAPAFMNAEHWKRDVLFKGFKVRGWGGIFSPGAPGFPYVFQMPRRKGPPLILLAGDCTGSAYIFTPKESGKGHISDADDQGEKSWGPLDFSAASASDNPGAATALQRRPQHTSAAPSKLTSGRVRTPEYQLAYEVEVGATVGSAAVCEASDGSGDVNIFVPSYELNQVHVYRLHEERDDGSTMNVEKG